jgi:TRAP transporter TAXI family solute receptor
MTKVGHVARVSIAVFFVGLLILEPASLSGAAEIPKSVAIGTTSIGSTTYVVSVGIADFISKYTGISAVAEVGGGADAILRLLRDGKVQLAMVNSFAVTHAYRGDLQFTGERRTPIRALIWGSPSLRAPIVREASGIRMISDFAGKRILARRKVGADTEITFNALIKAYGVDPGSVKVLTYSKPKEIMDALKTRTADGAIWPVGLKNPNVMELQETVKLVFPSISKDKWNAVLKELGPSFYIETIPANTYKNQPTDVYAPSIQMGFGTLKDFPEEAVYQIVKAVLSRYDDFKLIHEGAKDYTPANTLKQFCVPFHPGAIRYYKEIGAWTSEHDRKQKEVLAIEGE